MTICINAKVVRKDGSIITLCGTDSRVSLGDRNLQSITMEGSGKDVSFPGAVVALSGAGSLFEALLLLREDTRYCKTVSFNSRADVREFILNLFHQFNLLIEAGTLNKDDCQAGTILITTPDRIWGAYSDLSIFEFTEFGVSGSGGNTANAVLMALYPLLPENPSEEDLENFIRKAIEITNSDVQSCGGAIHIFRPEVPNPLLTKKSKKKNLTNKNSSDKVDEAPEGVKKSAKQTRPSRNRTA